MRRFLREAMERRRHLVLAFSAAIIILGVRLWQLHRWYPGGNLFLDEWFWLEPWGLRFASGNFHWADCLTVYNDHRLFLTRLTYILCYLVFGHWEPLALAAMVALMYAIIGFAFTAILLRPSPKTLYGPLVVVPVIIVNILPFGYIWSLWAGNLPYRYWILFALCGLWGMLLHRPFSWRWLLGVAGCVLSCLEIGAGGLVAATVVGMQSLTLIHSARRRERNRWGWVTLLVAGLVLGGGVYLQVTAPALKAPEWRTILDSFGKLLAWPHVFGEPSNPGGNPWVWAAAVHMPFLLFAGLFLAGLLAGRRAVAPDETLVFAMGVFLAATMAGMAYGRSTAPVAERYYHLLSVELLCSVLSCCFLWRRVRWRSRVLRVLLSVPLLAWCVAAGIEVVLLCGMVGGWGTAPAPGHSEPALLAREVRQGLSQLRMFQSTLRRDELAADAWNCDFNGEFMDCTIRLLSCAARRRFLPVEAVVPAFPPAEACEPGFELGQLPFRDDSCYGAEHPVSSYPAMGRTTCFVSKPFLTESKLLQVPVLEVLPRDVSGAARPERLDSRDFHTCLFRLPKARIGKLRFRPVENPATVILKSLEIRAGGRLIGSADFFNPQQIALENDIQCVRTYDAGAVFRCGAGAPSILFPALPELDATNEAEVCCSIRMWSSVESVAELSWDTGSGWAAGQSQHEKVVAASQDAGSFDTIQVGLVAEKPAPEDFHSYVFELPSANITKLRLVPASDAADVILTSLEIDTAAGTHFAVNCASLQEAVACNACERLDSFKGVCALRCHAGGVFTGQPAAVEFPALPPMDLSRETNVRCTLRMWASTASSARLYWDTGGGWTEEQSCRKEVAGPVRQYVPGHDAASFQANGGRWIDVKRAYVAKRSAAPWSSYLVSVPDSLCRIVLIDNDPSAWVACAAPRDYPRYLPFVERVVALNAAVIAAGLLLLLLCALTWRRRSNGNTAASDADSPMPCAVTAAEPNP